MFPANAKIARDIESVLRKEIALYKEYLRVLDQEQKFLAAASVDKITESTAKRQTLLAAIGQIQNERLALMKQFPESLDQKLSTLVERFCHAQDAARLKPLIDELRATLKQCKKQGIEFSQSVGFSLNIVNGLLTILWSATQNVLKGYGNAGTLTEAYHPQKTRAETVLKKA